MKNTGTGTTSDPTRMRVSASSPPAAFRNAVLSLGAGGRAALVDGRFQLGNAVEWWSIQRTGYVSMCPKNILLAVLVETFVLRRLRTEERSWLAVAHVRDHDVVQTGVSGKRVERKQERPGARNRREIGEPPRWQQTQIIISN